MTSLKRFLLAAKRTGCPSDQVTNFRQFGYVPQPKQLRFHAAARACDEPNGPNEIGYGGARGGGKSHCMLAQLALDDCQRAPGIKALLLRKIGKAVRESFEDLRNDVLYGINHYYRRHEGVVEFDNGSKIILGHFNSESDIDAYLGLEYEAIGVEEATTLSLSKYKAIRTCNRTSRDDWRPRTYSNANPGGVGHTWYKQRFIEPSRLGQETETRFVGATVDDNAFINEDYRKTLEDLTGWRKQAWRYGDWDIAVGQFLTTWNYGTHVVEPFPIPAHWRVWLAMDYGWTHYTVVLLFAENDDGTIYVVDEHAERKWLVSQNADAVKAMLERHKIRNYRVWKFVAGHDCFNEPLDIAAQWEAQGFKLERANIDRVNGAAECLRRLGDPLNNIPATTFVFNCCRMLIDCIPAMEHDPHRPEDVLKTDIDEEGQGGDDAYDAWRYGLMVKAKEYAAPKVYKYV